MSGIFFFLQLSKFLFECQDSNSSYSTFKNHLGWLKHFTEKMPYIIKECRKINLTTIHNSTKNYMKNVILGHWRSAGNKILIFKVACFLVKIRVQWLEQAEKHGCHSRNGWLTARDLSVKIRSAMPTLSWEMVQPTKWTVLEQAFLTWMQLTINLWAVNTVWCPAKSMRDPQATSTWTLQTLQQQNHNIMCRVKWLLKPSNHVPEI